MVLAQDLRDAVLQAALQGKLTEQLATDSPVEELYIKINDRRNKLILNKTVKNKKLDKIKDDEIPFEIPTNWKWVRINNIYNFVDYRGKTPTKLDKGIRLIGATNIKKGYLDFTSEDKYISQEEFNTRQSRGLTKFNDILFVTEGGTIGNASLNSCIEKCSCGQRVITFQSYIEDSVNNKLYLYFIMSNYFQSLLKGKQTGSAATGIKGDTLKTLLLPLPPIEEQQRIVDKVEELMAQIDDYEKVENQLLALHKAFPENMKASILQAAMQGKLTEQLDSDSSVDELLEEIKKEKESLTAQKKIKKEKPLPIIEDEDIPFKIPENWRWVRLGNIGTLTRGSGIKKTEVFESGPPCVRYGELYTTYKTKFYVANSHTSKEIFDKSKKVNNGDILMALTGENNFDIALAVTYLGSETIAMGGDLTVWSNHHMNPLYLTYAMNSAYAINEKSKRAKGDIIVHISNDKLATICIPLPPVEEQQRIVEKLEQFLPLCEGLK